MTREAKPLSHSRKISRFKMPKFSTFCFLVFAFNYILAIDANAAGVWTKLTNLNPAGGSGTMMLLTDGTVIVQGPGVTKVWKKLTPDSSGNYTNGTWSSIASMGTERLYFGSNVLPSGKVFLVGGEYSGPSGNQNITNTGEIYDPVANTWTPIAPFPKPEFGDDPTVLLPNGKVLCGYIFNASTYLYDPATNTWAATGTKLRSDASDEETWMLLPDGSVLSYDVFASPAAGAGTAQRYLPASGTWVSAGTVPVPLTGSAFGFELGPASLLPDGRLIQIGANNNTAIYTPSSSSWAAGPTLPANMGSDDAPGAMLPDGHFLIAADTSSPAIFTGPTRLYDFDYKTNQITDVTPAALSSFLNLPAFLLRMLVLPNGHLLLASGESAEVWEYTPSGTPLASWAPTIVGTPFKNGSGTYTLTGTQLTGISEGATYGDDAEMSTNYPIVKLVSSTGKVTYARTTNWTPGVATGSLQTTVNFAVPASLPIGNYQLSVIANGIPSLSKTFNVGGTPSDIMANLNAGELTVTGTDSANTATISVQGSMLKVEGANGTKVNGLPSVSWPFSGNLKLTVDMKGGDDSVAFVGISGLTTTSTIQFGDGNDKVAFTLCNMGIVNLDGGTGTNTLITTSSKFVQLNKLHF